MQEAEELLRSGRLADATRVCLQRIAHTPGDAAALAMLGILALRQGDWDGGIDWLGRSLAAQPHQPQILAIRAVALRRRGRLAEALASCDQALALQPDYAEAAFDRAGILRQLDRREAAMAGYRQAIAVRPDYAEAHAALGVVLFELSRSVEALAAYEKALTLRPQFAEVQNDCGVVLQAMRRLPEARVRLEKALAIRPGYAEAQANLASVLLDLLCTDEARSAADRAIALDPRLAFAHAMRAAVLQEQGEVAAAMQSYDHALMLDPGSAAARWGKATLCLLQGDYAPGWRLYESRWDYHLRNARRAFAQAPWRGQESLAGKTLLIYAEQGYGDFLQCCRLVSLAATSAAHIVLEVPAPLKAIAQTLDPAFTVVEQGAALPAFDLHCPVMSLPLAFGITVETVPNRVPYLNVLPGQLQTWRQRLGEKSRPRIGLAWSGSPGHKNDARRSIPAALLQPLLDPSCEFHCLQIAARPEDANALSGSGIVWHSDHLRNFSDTAALASLMDLVISVDTSVAHLAGALGIPVWILLPRVPDFRWLLDRNDTPWYPSARLFRQASAGAWPAVIEAVRLALRSHDLKN